MRAQDELGELYHASYRRLVAQVFAFTTDLTEAQDAVQEAFARALARRNALADVDTPEAWLRTVAVNVVRRRWRRRQLLNTILLRERPLSRLAVPAPEPDRTDLRGALAAIPRQYREVIVLHYLADLPVDEVAALLEVPVGTVKSRLSRGREALKELLDDVEAPPLAQVSARAAQLRRQRHAAQATGTAAVLVLIGVTALGPWSPLRTPAAVAPASTAGPSAGRGATPTYAGSGITVLGVADAATVPDLPGTVTSIELDGRTGWLRTACVNDLPGCSPRFARTGDGGQTWTVTSADAAMTVPGPPDGPPDLGRVTWVSASATPGGVWWAAGLTSAGMPTVASSTDAGATWHSLPLPAADAPAGASVQVKLAVRQTLVVALVVDGDAVVGGYRYDGSAFRRTSAGAGATLHGDPVLLADGRLLIADAHGRWQVSGDLGATFSDAGNGLPWVGSLTATSSGYAALDLFQSGWVAVSEDGLTWHKLPIR